MEGVQTLEIRASTRRWIRLAGAIATCIDAQLVALDGAVRPLPIWDGIEATARRSLTLASAAAIGFQAATNTLVLRRGYWCLGWLERVLPR